MDFVTSLRIESINSLHDCSLFASGEDRLDDYLRRYARQNDSRNIARAFVAIDEAERVLGFYTLGAANINFEDLPSRIARRLPAYPIPAALIGELAIDTSVQGQGMGARLLINALARINRAASEIAVKVVLVDALTNEAKAFYQHFGFIEFKDQPMTLFLPIEALELV